MLCPRKSLNCYINTEIVSTSCFYYFNNTLLIHVIQLLHLQWNIYDMWAKTNVCVIVANTMMWWYTLLIKKFGEQDHSCDNDFWMTYDERCLLIPIIWNISTTNTGIPQIKMIDFIWAKTGRSSSCQAHKTNSNEWYSSP